MAKKKEKEYTRAELNQKIIHILKTGGNTRSVENYLKSINREKSMRADIHSAYIEINESARIERETLISTHVKRYEKIYNDNIKKTLDDFAHLPEWLQRHNLISCFEIALDSLVAKEKVLGLHTRTFRIQLNNFYKKKIVSLYNFNNQNFEDLTRLKFLLDKMRTSDMMETIIVSDLEADLSNKQTIDTDYVEINEEASSKIKEKVTSNEIEILDPKIVLESLKEKIIIKDIGKADKNKKNFLKKLDEL